MKKLLSLLIVLVFALAIPATAVAASYNGYDYRKEKISAMRNEANSLVGKTYTASELTAAYGMLDAGSGNKLAISVENGSLFVSQVFIKSGIINTPITGGVLYKMSNSTKYPQDGALVFKLLNGRVLRVGILIDGNQYYAVNNTVVKKKFSAKEWDCIRTLPRIRVK